MQKEISRMSALGQNHNFFTGREGLPHTGKQNRIVVGDRDVNSSILRLESEHFRIVSGGVHDVGSLGQDSIG